MWMWMEALWCKTGMKPLKHIHRYLLRRKGSIFSMVGGNWKSLSPRERIWGSNVTSNTRGGFMRNSAPLWARGQDAFLVIHRSRDWSQIVTLFVKLIQVPFWFWGNPLQAYILMTCFNISPKENFLSHYTVIYVFYNPPFELFLSNWSS